MPKPDRTQAVNSLRQHDLRHYRMTDRYAKDVQRLYDEAVKDFTDLAGTLFAPDPNAPFSFADSPRAKKEAARLAVELTKNVQHVIETGQRSQWLAATIRANEYLGKIINRSKLTPDELKQYEDRNLEGLAAFQGRKVQGMNLSERVWKITDQFTGQMELAIDASLGQGKSAAELSRDVRGLLNKPKMLFRRVRDKYGNLNLSKAAAAYHPGRGVYRSSAQNAMRLARTEINMAYRTADWERWQNEEHVVGIRIQLSNNHTIKNRKGEDERLIDICDELAGDYPKTFKFVGWHPNCRCTILPILQRPEEMHEARRARLREIMNGEAYKAQPSADLVTDVPEGFKRHIEAIAERSKGWASIPYYIRDNFKGGTIAGGLSKAIPHGNTVGGNTANPYTPPQPCTEFDSYIDDFKSQAYSLGLDVSRLDSLRAAGDREQLKAEIDRLQALSNDRSMQWLAAVESLRNFIQGCEGASNDFTNKYLAIAKANSYSLKTYYRTAIDSLNNAKSDAEKEWQKHLDKKAKEEVRKKAPTTVKAAQKEFNAFKKKAEQFIKTAGLPISQEKTLQSAIYGAEAALYVRDLTLYQERMTEAKKWLLTYQTPNMPGDLHPGDAYLSRYGDSYEFSESFFDLLEAQPVLVIRDDASSFCAGNGGYIEIGDHARRSKSKWFRHSVIYHEFGHAIVHQRGLLNSKELIAVRKKQIDRLTQYSKEYVWVPELSAAYNEDGSISHFVKTRSKVEVNQMRAISISQKIEAIYNKVRLKQDNDPIFKRYGITKKDAIEQITALADTLRSLVNREDVGWGHDVAYFDTQLHTQNEWAAHAFENAFIGNRAFQLLMPVEYQEMIDYIRTLKKP